MSFTWCFHQKPGKTPVWFSAESARRDLLAAESESQGVTMVLTLQSQPLYPLVMSDKKLLKMAIEIVDLPMKPDDFPWLYIYILVIYPLPYHSPKK